MALPFGRATFFGPGRDQRRKCVFGGQDHRECFQSSGVSGRKICCDAPKTSQSGALAGKLHIDAPKGSEMNMKMTETGHMGRKHSLLPRRMI